MEKVRVAAAQITPTTFDMKGCVSKICECVDKAADRGAQLVVFGEMACGGYPGWRPSFIEFKSEEFIKGESEWVSKKLFNISETIPGTSTEKLCSKARERNVYIATGFAEADGTIIGNIYNSSILIGSDGSILGRHRKLHVASMELFYWKKGGPEDLKVFPTPLGKVGLAICADVCYPEYTRLLDLMGEQIQCDLWATSAGYEFASNSYPIVRATEGGVFVVSSCIVGKDELTHMEYRGESMIVDPFGTVLAKAKPGVEDIILADVNLDSILDYRSSGMFTLGMDRRNDIYSLSAVRRDRGSEPNGESPRSEMA